MKFTSLHHCKLNRQLVKLQVKCSGFSWDSSFQVTEWLLVPVIAGNDSMIHSSMEIISWNRAFQLHFPLGKMSHFSNQPGVKHFLVHLLQDSHVNPTGWMVMRLWGCGTWWMDSCSYFVLGEEWCKVHVELTWLASIWSNLLINCVYFWCSCFPSLICSLIVGGDTISSYKMLFWKGCTECAKVLPLQ
jgi:hypothetical protein